MQIKLRYVILLLLLLSAVSAIFGRLMFPPDPVVLPPLPPDVIEVEVVKEILVPGPERVVERVSWKTKEVPVPVETIRTIRETVRVPVPGEPAPPVLARVDIEADQYEGVKDGILKRGWKGWARCSVRLTEDSDWLPIVDEPIDLETSVSISTLKPEPIRPLMNRVDLGLGVVSSQGLLLEVGYHRRLLYRSKFLRAILPDWAGLEVSAWATTQTVEALVDVDGEFQVPFSTVLEGSEFAVTAKLGWEF